MIATLTSCEVDRISETNLSDQSFWSSENDLKLAANYFYTSLPELPTAASSVLQNNDVWSDDAFGSLPDAISDGSRIPGATDVSYTNNYLTIRATNNLIEKSSKVLANGAFATNVNWYIGEAKYFRARAYYNLLQRYGGVPLIFKTLDIDSPELQAPQATREEVVEAIYADLDDAILKLKTRTQLGTADYGRISKTAALTLKAQVALFEGTRSKFHGYGNPTKHLTIAKDAAKLVIQSGEHSLFTNYFQLWQYEGEGIANRETILVRQYGKNLIQSTVFHASQRLLEQGLASPTKALVDAYLMKDGLPYTKSPLYRIPTKSVEVFTNRDPRMGAKILKEGDAFSGSVPVFKIPSLSLVKTGYTNRLYQNIADWNSQRSFIDMPITRYAEVLLIYAEATYELTETISDADLDLSINLLRQRPTVGMPKLTNAFVSSNGLNMRDEIRRERRIELALEGYRYWDLMRWKTAEIELPKDVLGSLFFTEYGTTVKPLVNSDNYILVHRSSARKFNPAKDYLWPFPTNERALNPNLKQNPNW